MKPRWHVVAWIGYDWKPEKHKKIWTVSRSCTETGWQTDCACPGYGLTYRQAKELADAANKVWKGKAK